MKIQPFSVEERRKKYQLKHAPNIAKALMNSPSPVFVSEDCGLGNFIEMCTEIPGLIFDRIEKGEPGD